MAIAAEEDTALTPDQWQQAEEILSEILELAPEERPAALDRACQGDDALRSELESLIAASQPAESFIETPVFSLRSTGTTEVREGQRVGSYRIERLLGRGGMGSVFLATRIDEFQKRVALKILKPGLNTEAIVRRFRHERQILAHLDHPNIAKLLDGGSTDDGLPYFVMEFVEGEPIDQYCDRHRLTVRQRLALFRKVCAAVHLAHQNLIVHRDLKPANILVASDGEPKLLDFGIAKPLDPSDASTWLTATGAQPMTQAYARPEQVDGGTLTTASDIYTLGVILYELISGRRPYRIPSSKWLDLAHAIREEQPEKPSTAIGRRSPTSSTTVELGTTRTLDPADSSRTRARHHPVEPLAHEASDSQRPATEEPLTAEELSYRRSTDPRGLRRRLSGDLDSIVLMALRKEVSRRYPTVEQFSQDIDRFLTGLPVVARPATLAYQAGKFVRRHTWESILAALLLFTIIGFGITALRIRDQAVLERERAEEVTGFLVSLFESSNPDASKGEDVTAREILDRGREQIETYRDNEPRLYAMLAATMGHVYYNLGLYEQARPMLEAALPGLQRQLGGTDDRQLAIVVNDLAAVLWGQGDSKRAETLF
ncbi:MAG: serine/threonine-protein kinase, partial [Acidobacteriota bacterium]